MTYNEHTDIDIESIWDKGYRIFISHNNHDGSQAGSLKFQLELFGASVFVAHDDIRSGEQWQNELEIALHSAGALIALLTPKFRVSSWTDQEVGIAYCRGLRIISVTTDPDVVPHGFLGQNQAFPWKDSDVSLEIMKFLIGKEPQLLDDYINRIANSGGWATSGRLGRLLPHIPNLSPAQIERVVCSVSENSQVRNSWEFANYIDDLNKIVGNRFERNGRGVRLKEHQLVDA